MANPRNGKSDKLVRFTKQNGGGLVEGLGAFPRLGHREHSSRYPGKVR